MKSLLFLCTGNYYRSRLAEILFNHRAPGKQLPWQAWSRGVRINPGNVGPISPYTIAYLKSSNLPPPDLDRFPISIVEADFWRADRIIALKEAEHRAMLEERFPHWANRTEYWSIDDLDVATPEIALPHLDKKVDALLAELATK